MEPPLWFRLVVENQSYHDGGFLFFGARSIRPVSFFWAGEG